MWGVQSEAGPSVPRSKDILTETVKLKSLATRSLFPGLAWQYTMRKERTQAGAHRRVNETAAVQTPAFSNCIVIDK